VEEIAGRLALLQDIRCPWWVIEIREPVGLLKTKEIIEAFLTAGDARRPETEIPLSPAASLQLGRA